MENNQPVTPQEQPVMQTSPAPKRSNVLVMVIGGIVLLGLGLLGGYFLFGNKNQNLPQVPSQNTVVSPTVMQQPSLTIDETANWQTYTNSTYTYSIKYPQELTFYEQNDKSLAMFLPTGVKETQIPQRNIVIAIAKNTQGLTAQDWWSAQVKQGLQKGSEEKISLGNLDAISVKLSRLDSTNIQGVVIASGNFIYQIQLNEFPQSEIQKTIQESIFAQMLSTFMITK